MAAPFRETSSETSTSATGAVVLVAAVAATILVAISRKHTQATAVAEEDEEFVIEPTFMA
jgi:hypothetical protein